MSIVPFSERREKPWGHELVYTPADAPRTGKALYIQAGKRLSLQYHTKKEETMALLEGEAVLWAGPSVESLEKIPMQVGAGYAITPGTVHRVEAVRDSIVLEVSSPEEGTTVRLEDDYQRGNEEF